MRYEHFINLDERGEYFADVRNPETGDTIFEIHGFDMVDDGFMQSSTDMDGLTSYLRDMKIIGEFDFVALA